jgi:hypothetical protein
MILTLLLLGLFCSYPSNPSIKHMIPVQEPMYHAISQKQWREYDPKGQGYNQLTEEEWLHVPWMKKGINEMTEVRSYPEEFAGFSSS